MKGQLLNFLRKLKNDRRGVALEMALTLLVVTFALSTLVLTTSLLQHSQKVRAENEMSRSVILEQIGESFCAAVAQNTDHQAWIAMYPDYDITVNDLTLTVTEKESGESVLTVELTARDGGGYTVAKWNKN